MTIRTLYEPTWIIRVGDAASQLVNVMLLNGDPNESVSGRCFRRVVLEGSSNWGWKAGLWLIDTAFFWQARHCQKAHQHDVLKAKMLLVSTGR